VLSLPTSHRTQHARMNIIQTLAKELLEERLAYLRELEERREAVLRSIDEQGRLDDDLRAAIEAADTKTRLEDLYAPYKPKRRTKAQIAREAGIEPLLDNLLDDPGQKPEAAADAYIDAEAGFADAEAVLEGARQIFMERVAERWPSRRI